MLGFGFYTTKTKADNPTTFLEMMTTTTILAPFQYRLVLIRASNRFRSINHLIKMEKRKIFFFFFIYKHYTTVDLLNINQSSEKRKKKICLFNLTQHYYSHYPLVPFFDFFLFLPNIVLVESSFSNLVDDNKKFLHIEIMNRLMTRTRHLVFENFNVG